MTLEELTNNRLEELEKALKWCDEKLKASPEGALYPKYQNNGLRYFNYDAKNSSASYLGDDKAEMIKALELKAYCTKLKKTALKEKQNLEKVQMILEKTPDWKTVFYDIPKERRHLIKPLEISPLKVNESGVEKWNRTVKKKNDPTPNTTVNGEHVKSKSELIIADRLERAGVPYHYEEALPLAEEKLGQFMVWYPDFKVLNTRTGKEYWWEHFGMMDNPDYFATIKYKLMVYAMNDIFMGDNLIVTLETTRSQLNTEYVDAIIRHYLK